MHRIEVIRSDITSLDVDAIVNAANERMLGGGGVDGAIHAAAGPELQQACRQVHETRPGVRCPTGEARITPGFRLRTRYVIHTVGPVWRDGTSREPQLLAACYQASIALAAREGLRSIAFPAISCGVYGYPLEAAARTVVDALRSALPTAPSLERVLLVAFEAEVADAWRLALGARDPDG